MDRYPAENRLLITYEGLTDDLIGTEVARGLNDFLGRAAGVTTIADEAVPCIWRAVVKNEPPPQQKKQIEKLQGLARNQPQDLEKAGQRPQQPQRRQRAAEADAAEGDSLDRQLLEAQGQLLEAQQLIRDAQPSGETAGPNLEQQLEDTQQQLLEARRQIEQHRRPQGRQPGVRRRLDPGHHNSQRKGPAVPRPYTPEQLDKMMNMLLEVGQRYHKEDVRLYHIMMGYYENIREARLRLSAEGGGA
ncbi:hypothetical protein ACHAWF_006968, partial [Thalassiosira exigua]